MGKKKRKNIDAGWLAKRLKEICSDAQPEGPNRPANTLLYLDLERGGCYINADKEKIIDEIIERINFSPLYCDNVEEHYARELTREAIITSFLTKEWQEVSNQLVANLKSKKMEWEAVIPLDGIVLPKGESLHFGKVEIEPYNEARASEYSDPRFQNIVMEGEHCDVRFPVVWGKTNAVANFSAFQGSEDAIAMRLVEEALDILRLFLLKSGNYLPDELWYGVKGGGANHVNSIAMRCVTSGELSRWGSIGRCGMPVVIKKSLLDMVKKNKYFSCLSEILQKEFSQTTPFEKRIVVSARWLGMSYAVHELNLKFLCAAICLESLLSFSGVSLTEHLAICVSRICADSNERRGDLYAGIKMLYEKRSNLVHTGEDKIGVVPVATIRNVAVQVLRFVLDRWPEIKTDEQWTAVLVRLKTS